MVDRKKFSLLVELPGSRIFIVFIAIFMLLLFVPGFGQMLTISNFINAESINSIMLMGTVLLLISGEFDLSVSAMMAMGGYIFAVNTINNRSTLLTILLVLIVTSILGAINGLITLWANIPSFITTLGTSVIYRGAIWVYSGGVIATSQVDLPVYHFFNNRLDAINHLWVGASFQTSTIWAIILAIIFHCVLSYTTFGNHVFAVGGNPNVARAVGINVKRVKLICFTLNGFMAGLAGIIFFSFFRSIMVRTGDGVELLLVAAAVMGGALMNGGYGSILGGFVGIFLISMIRTGVVLLGFPPNNFESIVGIAIIGVAILNHKLKQRLD